MRTGAAAAAASALGGCGLFTKKRPPEFSVEARDGRFRVPAAQSAALREPGGSLVVAVAGLDDNVLLFRRPSGEIAAVSLTCTHLGCDVDYRADEDLLVCPCHGSRYDPWGRVLKGPAKKPLASYRVREQAGDVVGSVS